MSSQSEMKTKNNKSKLGSGDGEFWSDADFDFGYYDYSKRIKKQEDICAQIDAIFRDCHSEDVGKGIEIQHASTKNDSSEDDFFGQWEPKLMAIATNLIDIHRVDAILGVQTLEEVLAVGEIGGEA